MQNSTEYTFVGNSLMCVVVLVLLQVSFLPSTVMGLIPQKGEVFINCTHALIKRYEPCPHLEGRFVTTCLTSSLGIKGNATRKMMESK